MHVRSCVCFLSLLDRDGNENVKKAILESAKIYRFQRTRARRSSVASSSSLRACIVRYSTVRIEVLPNSRHAGIFQISTIQKPLTHPGVKLDEKMSICSSTTL